MLIETFSTASQACSTFDQFARMSLTGGKTYEQSMRFAFVGETFSFTTQTAPADLSDSDFLQGCADGIGSTNRGNFLLHRTDSSSPATATEPSGSASTTSITGAQLGTTLSTYFASRGVPTTSFQCPAGPYSDGERASCVFVRADDGTSWSIPVGVSIQNGKVSVAPDTPTKLLGGN